MAPLSSYLTIALSLLTTSALAGPIIETRQTKTKTPKPKNLLGYDTTAVSAQQVSSGIIPTLRIWTPEDLADNITATHASPSHVSNPPLATSSPVGTTTTTTPSLLSKLKRYINGKDNRHLWVGKAQPWTTIGKLYWSNGVFCSASLIGPRHILTAKHCYVPNASATFAPGFNNGVRPRLGSATVTNVFTSNYTWGTPCGWKNDWAIMVLDTRLGDDLGYFGAVLPDKTQIGLSVFDHVGYPYDRSNGQQPYRVWGNTILKDRPWDCDATGPFYSDTDCMGGQSGGPHFRMKDDGNYIWGTLSVTFDGGNGKAWAGWGSGDEMLAAIVKGRNDFP